jgi:radical SAM protein with 4Fe4S-binding SPASM domain
MDNFFPHVKEGFKVVVGPVSYVHSLINRRKYYELNQDAAEIVVQCNGKSSVEEIAQDLANKYQEDYVTTLETIRSYIFSEEFIGISKTPVSTNNEILGKWNIQSPAHVSIELTYKCNFYCKHCYNNCGFERDVYLNKDEFFKLADDLRDHGVVTVELTGGEPLMHPDFSSIIKYCLDHFNMVGVITNGYFLTEEILDNLIQYRDKLIFQVGLHGESEYMEWFCGLKGAFDNAKRAIKLLNERRFLFKITMIITPMNIFQIYRTVKLARSLVDDFNPWCHISMSPIVELGRGKSPDLLLAPEHNNLLIKTLERVDNEFGNFVSKIPEHYYEYKNCGAGCRSLSITPNGDVKLCVMADENLISWGNISRDGLTTILSGDLSLFFNSIDAPNSEICGECENAVFCGFCLTRGIKKYSEIKENCVWAQKVKLNEFLQNFKLANIS